MFRYFRWSTCIGLVIAAVLIGGCTAAATPTAVPTSPPAPTTIPPTAMPQATAMPEVTTMPNATAMPQVTAMPGGIVTATPAASANLLNANKAAMDAAGGKQLGGTVSVLATWGGDEQDSFMAMVKPFEDATGTKIQYTGTRDLNAVLTTQVQGGNPPDLAGLPGPGQMAQFAQQGKLVDLSKILDMNTMKQQYAQNWIDLASVDGKPVGIFIKASLKGLIWYDPKTYAAANGPLPPATWDDLQKWADQIAAKGTTPWCIGLENGAASGWPGTDWIEDFMLRQSGPDKYNQWYQGQLAWTSPEVKQAWQSFGKIATDNKMVYGGTTTELSTDFGKAGDPLFSNPPGCYLHHQASFITTFFQQDNPNLQPVTDFNFYGFPDINSQYAGSEEVAGDLFGMFKDTPQSEALMRYLTTPAAQAIWVKRGGAISPNKLVPLDVYPDPLSKQAAQLLTGAKITVFDASDLMPDAMNKAFWTGVLNYVQNPSSLDSILANLDSVQKDAYKP